MNLTPIAAFEGQWNDHHEIPHSFPEKDKNYSIRIAKTPAVEVNEKVWIGYSHKNHPEDDYKNGTSKDFLFHGIVLEITAVEEECLEILFQIVDIMPEEDILRYCPESAYPEHLANGISNYYGGCGYFGNKLDISKDSHDSYFLDIDYYGNEFNIAIRVVDEKMYAWYTSEGFYYLRSYYGKYLVPEWLKEIIESPHDKPAVKYHDNHKRGLNDLPAIATG